MQNNMMKTILIAALAGGAVAVNDALNINSKLTHDL